MLMLRQSAMPNAKMGKIATHPLTLCIHFHSRDRKCAGSGCVAYRFPDPVADVLHLIVAELHTSDDIAREITEPVRFAIAARQQVQQHRIGQILNLHKKRARGRIHRIRSHDIG